EEDPQCPIRATQSPRRRPRRPSPSPPRRTRWSRRSFSSRTSRSTGCAASTEPVSFELERPWALSPQVSLRPERFGALAYHFGTRRLSFLKSPRLLRVVESLADEPSALAACRRAGVPEAQMAEYA